MQLWKSALTIVLLATFTVATPLVAPPIGVQQMTDSEKQEARELAIQFTTQYLEVKDLTPLVKALYVEDFIERYKRSKLADLSNQPVDLYFVPGLDYNSRLLTEGGSDDWQRFYIAANNFFLLGFLSIMKGNVSDADKIKASDMYPPSVISLLNSNRNLANMIVRKGSSRAVGSVEEMRRATATLEQAVNIVREKHKATSAGDIDREGLIAALKEDAFFQPRLEVLDEEYFGFPKGTRITWINTPLLFRLMLVRADNRVRVFWAEPYTGS